MGKFELFSGSKISFNSNRARHSPRLLDFFHDLPPGHVTLIIGPNGSGKSFLALNIALAAHLSGRPTLFFSECSNDEQRLKKRPGYDPSQDHFDIINTVDYATIMQTIKSLDRHEKSPVIILDTMFYGRSDAQTRRTMFQEIKRTAALSKMSVMVTTAAHRNPLVDRTPGLETSLAYSSDMIVAIDEDHKLPGKMSLLTHKDKLARRNIVLDYDPNHAIVS